MDFKTKLSQEHMAARADYSMGSLFWQENSSIGWWSCVSRQKSLEKDGLLSDYYNVLRKREKAWERKKLVACRMTAQL